MYQFKGRRQSYALLLVSPRRNVHQFERLLLQKSVDKAKTRASFLDFLACYRPVYKQYYLLKVDRNTQHHQQQQHTLDLRFLGEDIGLCHPVIKASIIR